MIRARYAVGGRGVRLSPGACVTASRPAPGGGPASAQPSPGSLARLEHAYSLRDELDASLGVHGLEAGA